MSCGDPHDVDCSEVLDRVYLFIDQELAVDATGATLQTSYLKIEEHLHECAPCLQEYDLERLIKSLVARSCGCEHASDDLRLRVLGRIHELQASRDT